MKSKKHILNPEEEIFLTVVFRRKVKIKRKQVDEVKEKARKITPKNFDQPYFMLEKQRYKMNTDFITDKNFYGFRESQRPSMTNKKKGKVRKLNLQAMGYSEKLKIYGMYDGIVAKEVLSQETRF